MAAHGFAIQMNLYIAVDVIYTVGEDNAWRLSSAFPRTDYEYVAKIPRENRRPLHIGMDGVLQWSVGFDEPQMRYLDLPPIQKKEEEKKCVEKLSLCL